MVARSPYSTGRVNLAQGAVITIQGAGAALSPALGGFIANGIGFSPAFLVLGAAVREYRAPRGGINIVMDDSDIAIGMVAARGWKERRVLPW